jgi:nucleotide-binding universal stress UspA family protein
LTREVEFVNEEGRPLVVVGVDGSDLSIAALRWAVDYARGIRGRILAVTGYDVPWTIVFSPTYTEADYARDAHEALDRSVSEALGPDVDVPVEKRLVEMRPAQALRTAAQGAALLVVGSHGRGELPGMHLGSVAGYCVHHAPCPVLVFRGADTGR